jgi:hypothetical protein
LTGLGLALEAATANLKQSCSMPKWAKFIVALLLLPLCVGSARALGRVLRVAGAADMVWVPMIAGAACLFVVLLLLPKPMWLYVVGHELTHAVWTWLFGGRVKRFKATSNGGHVVVTRHNFLIALAPYFFPFYAVCVVLLFLGGDLLWNWARFVALFHLLLGAAYAFHLALTWQVLQTSQTDITQQGYLFSAVVIFLGNVWVLLCGVPLLTRRVELTTALGWVIELSGRVVLEFGRWF